MANPPILFAVVEKTDAWGARIMNDLPNGREIKARRTPKPNSQQKINATLRDMQEFQEQSLNVQVANNSMAAALQDAGLI